MKQIHIIDNEAPKLEGYGPLKYQLWINDSGCLYVQVAANANAGTFSGLKYSVTEYALKRKSTESIGKPIGFDPKLGAMRPSGNNDDGAFLKAVLCHLIDGSASI